MGDATGAGSRLGRHGRAALDHVRRRLFARPGNTGVVLATLFFLASLTPSLTPREPNSSQRARGWR